MANLPAPAVPVPYYTAPQYMTLEEARSYMSLSYIDGDTYGVDFSVQGPYNDQQIVSHIRQASQRIDAHIKDTLQLKVRTEETRGQDSNFIKMRHYPIWQGIQTTLTADALSGDTSVTVAETMGMQPGKYINFPQAHELPNPQQVDPTYGTPYHGGPGTVPLATPLQLPHAAGSTIIVNGLDFVMVILPNSVYPITTDAIVVQYALGLIQNFTPLIFQRTGYNPIFTKMTPIRIQYTSGFEPRQYPGSLRQACFEVMIDSIIRRRMSGLQSWKSGERSERYYDINKYPFAPYICDMLTEFDRSAGLY